MKKLSEMINSNIIHRGFVIDYNMVSFKSTDTTDEIIFFTEMLKRDLTSCGYDNIHIDIILGALHSSDSAIHRLI